MPYQRERDWNEQSLQKAQPPAVHVQGGKVVVRWRFVVLEEQRNKCSVPFPEITSNYNTPIYN